MDVRTLWNQFSARTTKETGTYDFTVLTARSYRAIQLKRATWMVSNQQKWTGGPNLLTRFRKKCELLFDGPLKSRQCTQKCKYVLLWSGDDGLDLFNTWALSSNQQKDLQEY